MIATKDILALQNHELDEPAASKVMQSLINSGRFWELPTSSDCNVPGSLSTRLSEALESGRVMLGREPQMASGYFVPSRTQVGEGRKGSVMYVAQKFGNEYADMIAAIE